MFGAYDSLIGWVPIEVREGSGEEPTDNLPATGASSTPFAPLAAALLLAGAVVMIASRRMRRLPVR